MAPRYPVPSRQPYTGAIVDDSPIFRNDELPYVGQLGPRAAATHEGWHGRRLAGLGESLAVPNEPAPGRFTDEPDWHDGAVQALEQDDDVVGSGVFDAGGRVTVHADMGVFQDHPSIPGYIDRNPPYTVNEEVRDVVNGGPTIEVSGGGLFYAERDGRPASMPTTRTGGGYVALSPSGSPASPVPWSSPTTVAPRPTGVPWQGDRSIQYAEASVYPVSTVNVAMQSRPVAGMGADEVPPEKAGWGSWLVGGLVVGVAGGLFWHTLYGKK